jgi:glutamate-1-semialdehyde 2,1-aminomutase
VLEAIAAAAAAGWTYGAPCAAEVELAELVCRRMPALERVRFVNSGTEATMAAVRLARAATARSALLKFDGCYHGHADSFLVKAGSGVATLGLPDSPGVPAPLAALTLTLPFNDPAALAELFRRRGDELAAVIVEPYLGNVGFIAPEPEFLATLRAQCDRYGALLIFDEVMTGFRVAAGGAQAHLRVRPDLTTLGKIIGGGMPVGAYGGRADLMRLIAPEGPVYQAGTLSGNPLAVACGLATLELIEQPGFYETLTRRTRLLADGLAQEARKRAIAFSADAVGGMFGIYFSANVPTSYRDVMQCDRDRFNRFFHQMLARGVYLAPSAYEAGFVSSEHDEPLIAQIVAAAGESFDAMGQG